MPTKQGRPISTESSDPVAPRERLFEWKRKQRHRLQRRIQQINSQSESSANTQKANTEDQDAAATLEQLDPRTKGLKVSQYSTQVSALHMRTGEIPTSNLLTLDRCLRI
jgi:hypothetical protein